MAQRQYIRDGRAPIPEDERVSRTMSRIRAKNTKPELLVRKALWAVGIRGYRLHWKRVPGRPDIAFPSWKVAVFIHGCYWHRCPHCQAPLPKTHRKFWYEKFQKNVQRDARKVRQLRKEGWKVLTLWECKVKKDVDGQVRRVRRALVQVSSR